MAFFLGEGVMAVGGIVELLFGVKAAQQSLEDIAEPLTAQDAEAEGEDAAAPSDQRPRPELAAEAAAGVRTRRRFRLGPGRTTAYSPSMVFSGPIPPRSTTSARSRPSSARSRNAAGRPSGASWRGSSVRASGARAASRRRCARRSRSGRANRISRNRCSPPFHCKGEPRPVLARSPSALSPTGARSGR